MKRIKKLINKKAKKHLAGKCKFCPCNIYEFLDVHRIKEGNEGGKYTDQNTVVCCRKCHQLIHDGKIIIEGQYPSISGKLVLHYFIDGQEFYD
jgi:hypothetical protein